MIRAQTTMLLWEIWRRNRVAASVAVAATIFGRWLDYAEQPTNDPSSVIALLAMVAFLTVFGICSYTETTDGRALGRFPRRLFTLPVSSLQLVAVPVLAGIACVEALYLLWLPPLSRGGVLSQPFVAVLLAAFIVFFQAVIWTLERTGPLRLLIAGLVAIATYAISLVPSWPPSPTPAWRSEAVVGAGAAGLAVAVFFLTWRHIRRLRCGGGQADAQLAVLVESMGSNRRARRQPFRSALAAQLWFEWRCSGVVLPAIQAGVLITVIAPLSWFARADAERTFQLILGTLVTPIILSIPIGMAFARPAFWSADLRIQPFVAVRPLSDEAIVAIKLKTAACSALAAWMLVLSFLAVWLVSWANLDAVAQLALRWWAFHEHSTASVYSMSILLVVVGITLTWRFLISRLWSGLSGSRPLFMVSVFSMLFLAIAGMVFPVDRVPGWMLREPARLERVAWVCSLLVIAKYWLAAYWWRHVPASYVRRYMVVWGAGTACLLALSLQLWGVIRIYVALDIYRFQAVMILLALLLMPVARVGLAPARLARNRHR